MKKKFKIVLFTFILIYNVNAQIVVTTGSPTFNYNGTNVTRPAHTYTWKDASNTTRTAVMIDQTNTYCGYLAQFSYAGKVCQGTGANGPETYGDGFVQNHSGNGGDDESTFRTGTNTLPLQGTHHSTIQYNLPNYTITDPGNATGTVPTTIQWFFATGRDYPIYSLTQDARALPANVYLNADSRSPYGDMHYDGSSPANGPYGGDLIGGISMGDTKKFVSVINGTTNESTTLTTNSGWKYTENNTIPYAMEWTKNVNAEQGHVQTQPISIKDAGRTDYSATPVAPGQQNLAGPFIGDEQYPYQISAYGILSAGGGVVKRLTWGTNFGYVGGANATGSFTKHFDNNNTAANAGRFSAYSVFDVFGMHTGGYNGGSVGKMVTQMENMQAATLTATVGTVVTNGPAGIQGSGAGFAVVPNVTYVPAGYNHIYATWESNAIANTANVTLTPTVGKPIDHPVFVFNNYSIATLTSLQINSVVAVADVDYFATFDAAANKIWITLNSNISVASNLKLNISAPAGTLPFNKYIIQPYGNDNTVRFFEKNNINLNNPANVVNVGNFVNGVLVDNNTMFVASDNIHIYTSPLPINHTKVAVNAGTVLATGFVIGMAIEPTTHNLFVTKNNNEISYYTAASNYNVASKIDIAIPGCCVPIIIANLTFDANGNLWATAFDGSTSGGAAAIWCFTKASNFSSMFIIASPSGKTASAANSLDGIQHNSLYLMSQPEGIIFDSRGDMWFANNNDTNGPDNSAGTLVKIPQSWLQSNIYGAVAGTPNVLFPVLNEATIYYVGGSKMGGIILDGDTLYINDQGQNQGTNILTNGKVWKWNVTTTFSNTNFANSGITTTYPGNGIMALNNVNFLPINLGIDADNGTSNFAGAAKEILNTSTNRLICSILPLGASPINGNVNSLVTIDATVQNFGGSKYVQRHIDIEPAINAATATAKVTLYFLNSEFQAYNTAVGTGALQLPDATISTTVNIPNLHLTQYHGTSATHLPGSYTGAAVDVTPESIRWNAYLQCWEVAINVTGFSGFFAKAGAGVLPLSNVEFSGLKQTSNNLIQWKVNNQNEIASYDLEKSKDGITFNIIANNAVNTTNIYNYTDNDILNENIFYYRLKIIKLNGSFEISKIIKINRTNTKSSSLFPNPVNDVITITVNDNKLLNTNASLFQNDGKLIKQFAIKNNSQLIDISNITKGNYFIKLANNEVLKFMKK